MLPTGPSSFWERLRKEITFDSLIKLRAEAKEKGRELIESGPGKPVQGEVHVGGELELIGSAEGLRTAAKTAYTGLVFRAGAKLVMSDAFDENRAYILEGTCKPRARVVRQLQVFGRRATRATPTRHHPCCQTRQPAGEWMR